MGAILLHAERTAVCGTGHQLLTVSLALSVGNISLMLLLPSYWRTAVHTFH